MRDLDYLKLLSTKFKNINEASVEIANLNAILSLPKGTEYFFSDLHGENQSLIHILRSASGIIRSKIKIIFDKELNDIEILDLANIIYYPNEKLEHINFENENTYSFQKDLILKLLIIVKSLSEKYTKSKVRKMMNKEYVYVTEELLYKDIDSNNSKKTKYYNEIIKNIVDIGFAKNFIIELCILIQKLAVDSLHIVGDICDRGPRQDLIFEELFNFHNVDIQWGNHDIGWMGAFVGNEVLMINALRIAVRYNCFDMLEDGYGINLRRLFDFSNKIYANDNCSLFMPKILDENLYDVILPTDAAKMQKALYVIQMKLEGQLIKKHPEYNMNDRIMLEKINFDDATVEIDNKKYKMLDMNFPTVNKNDVLSLNEEEKELVKVLKTSFKHSSMLKKHIKFLYDKGSLYKIFNGNLLFHGSLPLDSDGNFSKIKDFNKDIYYSGKKLFDYFEEIIVNAYKDYENNKYPSDNVDNMYYMWCGALSPLFGKHTIKTFELYFVDDKQAQKEISNPYYKLINDENIAIKILEEFGLEKSGHIINGHVPVKKKDGESPIKANGRVYVIDGGLSKGYQSKTGIAGYTLIYDSIHMNIATHKPYEKGKFNTPLTEEVEKVATDDRVYVRDTDIGKELIKQIKDLKDLLIAYKKGLIKERL